MSGCEMRPGLIRVRGLDRFHDDGGAGCHALREVDLDVAAGELVVLRGVSGSGKTTLLSILGALLRPTRGEVQIAGRRIAKLPDGHASAFRRDTVGFILQEHHLFDGLTVRENVALPLAAAGAAPREVAERAGAALRRAGIEHKADSRVSRLSGGEKQRCAIARALVNDPPLLLCDEPTANLDRASRDNLLAVLKERKLAGGTTLVATHDPLFDDWAPVDRIVDLEDGRLIGGIVPGSVERDGDR